MTTHVVGYARVSTAQQDLAAQLDALEAAGCSRTFTEKVSAAKADRPQLGAMLEHLRAGDTVVVASLDRLGRSLRELIDLVNGFEADGIGFRSLRESIDTTTAGGRLIFHVFASMAEFERDLIRERTTAGLTAARARGRKGGRRPVMTNEKATMAQAMYQSGGQSVDQIAKALGVGRSTIYRSLDMATAE